MFIDLAGSELQLSTGTTQAPPPRPAGSLEQRLSLRLFVQTLAPELDLDPILGPILRGAAVASGRLVDRNCAPVTDPARTLKGGTFLLRCGLLYRCERQRCGPPLHPRRRAGAGGLRAGALRLPLRPAAGTLLRAKTGSLRLAGAAPRLLDGQGHRSRRVLRRSCQTRERTNAANGGPRGLLHPLPLPSMRGGMIRDLPGCRRRPT